jgi:glycosyltransferase involved in cell wall biosynthesis
MRLLGVVIANGYSSEVRDFANIVAERGSWYEPLILFHEHANPHEKDRGAADEFEQQANTQTFRFDSGWRRNDDGLRSIMAKAGSWAALHVQLPRLIAIARRFRPDIVYSSQQRWDSHAASILAQAVNVPHVIHLHYTVGPSLGLEVLRRMKSAAAVFCVSDYIRQQALEYGMSDARLLVLPNTMRPFPDPAPGTPESVRHELGIPNGARLFSFFARLAPGKGHADALRAFARVVQEDSRARLIIAGDGPLQRSIENLVASLSLGERVKLLGYRKDVPALLVASDAFIHPSLGEPFGLSILEAMAAAKPVIAYRDGGPSEVIQDGGILVAPGDIAGLAEAMLRLGRDPELAARMGRIAKRDVEIRFNPKTEADRFGAFLRAIAAGTSSAVDFALGQLPGCVDKETQGRGTLGTAGEVKEESRDRRSVGLEDAPEPASS